MKKVSILVLAMVLAICSFAAPASAITTPVSVLYVMNYLSPETSTDTTLNDIKGSGFDTVIVFSVDGTSTGDLTFFGTPVFTNGEYVGPSGWPAKIASLKTGTTSVTRLGFCLGGNYNTYKTYMDTYGTGTTTNWYKNFAKLKELTGADFIDLNDENCYNAASLTQLGFMLDAIGYKVSLCPYTYASVWQTVKSNLGSIVDEVNLQCYDGGAYNNPATWNNYFGGLKVTPLFWTLHADGTGDTYSTAQTKVAGWKSSASIISAGAWQYSDMRDFAGGTAAQFNTAIRNGLASVTPTPTPTPTPIPGQVIANLSSYYNEDGFSYDTARSNGDYDTWGYTYSADLVSSSPTYDSTTYQLGPYTNGSNNSVKCSGQTITLTSGKYSSIRLIGSATNGNKTGTFRINYSDSTYTNVSVTMLDWCSSSISSQKVVQTMTHRHSQTADDITTNRIFAYYLTPKSSKTVTSIVCPNNSDIHVLGITLVP